MDENSEAEPSGDVKKYYLVILVQTHVRGIVKVLLTSLVKECADILITPITKIVNYSITEGSFPNCFKMAYVTPPSKEAEP